MRTGIVLPFALSSLVILVACTSDGSVIDGGSDSSLPPVMESSSSESSPEAMRDETSSESSDAAASVPADTGLEARVIEISMTDWEFAPASISASAGEKLIFRVTGVEGKHSFALADLGINVPVEVGQTVDIEIPTDTAGTFQFRCRIPCGPGHKDMVGTLVIS